MGSPYSGALFMLPLQVGIGHSRARGCVRSNSPIFLSSQALSGAIFRGTLALISVSKKIYRARAKLSSARQRRFD
jgi:hypothetical protein